MLTNYGVRVRAPLQWLGSKCKGSRMGGGQTRTNRQTNQFSKQAIKGSAFSLCPCIFFAFCSCCSASRPGLNRYALRPTFASYPCPCPNALAFGGQVGNAVVIVAVKWWPPAVSPNQANGWITCGTCQCNRRELFGFIDPHL